MLQMPPEAAGIVLRVGAQAVSLRAAGLPLRAL
jgi:hypothetical protein